MIDSDDRAFDSMQIDLTAGEVSSVIVQKVETVQGGVLKSVSSEFLIIEARVTGSGDPFVDLQEGIDLSSYGDGETVSFDIRFKAALTVTGRLRDLAWYGVVKSQRAGWSLDYLMANGDYLVAGGDRLMCDGQGGWSLDYLIDNGDFIVDGSDRIMARRYNG